MSQRRKYARAFVVIGHCADSRAAVAHPRAQKVNPYGILFRNNRFDKLLAAALNVEFYRIAAAAECRLLKLLVGLYGSFVYLFYDVALQKTAFLGRADVLAVAVKRFQLGNNDSVVKKFYAEGLSAQAYGFGRGAFRRNQHSRTVKQYCRRQGNCN